MFLLLLFLVKGSKESTNFWGAQLNGLYNDFSANDPTKNGIIRPYQIGLGLFELHSESPVGGFDRFLGTLDPQAFFL